MSLSREQIQQRKIERQKIYLDAGKKHPGGRPSIYSESLINELCERLANGQSLVSICKMDDMPTFSTVFKWLSEKPEFSDKYKRARELQAEYLLDQCTDIADDGSNDYMTRKSKSGEEYEVVNHEHISRSKLRVDTRLALVAQLYPKKYGNRQGVDLTSGGEKIQSISPIQFFETMTKI